MPELTQRDRLDARAYIGQRREYLEAPGTRRLIDAIRGPEEESDLESDVSDAKEGAD